MRGQLPVKALFPIFSAHPELVYLDSNATSQKPEIVIEAINRYYRTQNANVHRGIYQLSEDATRAFEEARINIANYLNAETREIIFTRGTTEAVNLVAQCGGAAFLRPGDEILLTVAEHHSNIVPWQIVAERHGAKVKFIPLNSDRRLDLDAARSLINEKTRFVSLGHVSNVLGVIHPIREIIQMARGVGALTMIDGAQGVPHLRIDVKELDCDFYAFSGHKCFGPTGIGVLYGKKALLQVMPPYQGGGDMIERVTLEGSTWNELPSKFEAGTPHMEGVIGLGAAIEFLKSIDLEKILEHDQALGRQLVHAMKEEFPKVKIMVEPGPDWVGTVTFAHESIHPHDLAAVCDGEGIAIRAGHHCAQPLMEVLGVTATARVSPSLYNDADDMNRFIKALRKAEQLFLG
ncbi:MAG: SufS family cysteine desulfurase [Proteobacteria bacterium]|nr:MAG: SufS family cysteine desulfurase [Pseudomonadota bacterium]